MTAGGLLRVIRPGLLTTVQDTGRWGYQAAGVPVAGPMDTNAHRLANLLVGNDVSAATLEVTLIGPELELEADVVAAVAGAPFDLELDGRAVDIDGSFTVTRGSRLRFGRRRAGARAYLAIAGGILTEPVLGSRATSLVCGMGGLEGRALAAGDVLPVVKASTSGGSRRAVGLRMPDPKRTRLRVLEGPQAEWFSDEAFAVLQSSPFRVSTRSNRMGYRLDGPPLARARREEPLSEPVTFGSIQVPSAGQPILLMADRQTAGGYPKIATVIAADLPLAGQLAPGDAVELAVCTREEAASALIAHERALLRQTAHLVP